MFGYLGQVDGHLGGRDAHADTVQDTACDEGAEAIGGNLYSGANEPPYTGKHDAEDRRRNRPGLVSQSTLFC